MSDNLLFQTQSRDIPSIAQLADCTFSSKEIKECFKDFQDPKMSSDTELNYIKEQHKRTLVELSKATAINKDLKGENAKLERKILQKDREIGELKSQGEMKSYTSRRLQEIDLNLPRLPNKLSVDENAEDTKSKKHLADYERTVKKLTSQNKSLKKEVEKLMETLKKYEDEKGRDSHDYYHKLAQELNQKLKMSEVAQNNVEKENGQLREKVEKLSGEASQLRKESFSLKKNYEELKGKYESLELTMSGNKTDYSTESGANSETTVGSNAPYSKRTLKKDMKWSLEGTDLVIQGKDSSVDFGREEYKKIVQDIMDIYKVKNPLDIVPSIKKMEKVIHSVPKLRKVVSDVAALVLPRVGCSQEKGEIELVVPSLKKLIKEIDESELLSSLRTKLIEVLQLDKDCPNIEIVKKVDKLATLHYQGVDRDQNKDGLENSLLSAQFTKIFGTQPSTAVFRQLNKQIEDFKHLVSMVKYKLKLEIDAKNESCLNQLIKVIENGVKEKQAAEVIHRVQGLLNCSIDSIVHTIDKMMFDRKKKEKTYSPHDF